ncbi:MAG: type II toxin-antitoxin system mRNA interferase toxin, RelE/StbE family [Candidatus Komeilibacteria bacterium]|nr:type II toxin-antitoxin system mRNA interferase toxin, RelE/StbE family [Candidatus Komeilibacteria bacterium]
MKISFHKNFIKQLKKLSVKERQQTKERLALFLESPFHEQLNNHPLKGKYLGFRSINIKGDLRAVYKSISESDQECIFVLIGNHSQLYSN